MEKPKPKKEEKKKSDAKVAVILIRNLTKTSNAVRDTFKMLRIHKKFTCVIVDKTESIMGMLNKVRNYSTFGEIDAETTKMLEDKRGKKDSEGKLKRHFHLCPPKGGFERKGAKHQYEQGGASGYRGTKINDLIKRML
jgi:large subunit ribosomal protein L30